MDFNFKEEQQQFADALKRWIGKDYSFEARSEDHPLRQRRVRCGLGHAGRTGHDGAAGAGRAGRLQRQRGRHVRRDAGDWAAAWWSSRTSRRCSGAEFLKLGGGHDGAARTGGGRRTEAGLRAGRTAVAPRPVRHRHHRDGVRRRLRDQRPQERRHPRRPGGQPDRVGAQLRRAARHRGRHAVRGAGAIRAGVTVTGYRTLDGQRAADIVFDNVQVPASALVGAAGAGWDILDAAADYGAGLLCAEALGAMEAIFAATLEYLKTRNQFGAPIGKFQALQHRMADMYIHLEQARSMALLAAVKLGSGDAARTPPRRYRRPSTASARRRSSSASRRCSCMAAWA